MLRNIVLLLFSLSYGASVFCQNSNLEKSYIVLKQDTIYGFVRNTNLEKNPSFVYFRTNKEQDWKGYSGEEISAFYTLGTSFESHLVSTDFSSAKIDDIRINATSLVVDSTLFLRSILKSELITLYEYLDENSKVHFYIRKDQDKPEELMRKPYYKNGLLGYRNVYWSVLESNLSDCSQIDQESIKKTGFGADSFKKIVNAYLKCKDVVTDSKKSANERRVVSFYGYCGVGAGRLSFSGLMPTYIDKLSGLTKIGRLGGVVFQAGFFLETIPSKLNPRLALSADIGIKSGSANGTGYFPSLSTSPSGNQSYDFQFTYITFRPGVRYTFIEVKQIKPFISLGVSFSYSISFKSRYELVENFVTGFSKITTDEAIGSDLFRKSELGLFISSGVKLKRVNFEIRFEWGSGVLQPLQNYASSSSTVAALVSYALTKK
jgi:hypothetical protein